MGVVEVNILNSTYPEQNIQESVSGWLFSNGRDFIDPERTRGCLWVPPQLKARQDLDQNSVISVDDTISTSDSNHESYTSESSTHTVCTAGTDPADIFCQEDDRDRAQVRGTSASCSSDEEVESTSRNDDQSYRTGTPNAQALPHAHPCSGAQIPLGNLAYNDRSVTQPKGLRTRGNNRRSNASGKALSPPCKLRRDTDCTDTFVNLLIIFATRMITAFWPLSACPPMMSTCFNGAGVLPLRVFIQETLKRSKASYSTLQVALYYLVLLKAQLPCSYFDKEHPNEQTDVESPERAQCRAMQCGRRMFLAALILASKYLQDRNYSARAWSKISGLRSVEINDNEREYLYKIDYNLHFPKESFDNWNKIVILLSKLSKERPPCQGVYAESWSGGLGSGSGKNLADMVSNFDLEETADTVLFTDDWWTNVIRKLNPSIVKDATLTDEFLRKNIPITHLVPPIRQRQPGRWGETSASESLPPAQDLTFNDSLRGHMMEQSLGQTPQTPAAASPAPTSDLPIRPRLPNLPTPQSTPHIQEGPWWINTMSRDVPKECPTSLPRCSASMDALRSVKKQCLAIANLDRCPPPQPPQPPPQPHGQEFSSAKLPMCPAATRREMASRLTPPYSPPSDSDASASASRSRSSSVSSNSSWSSLASGTSRPRFVAGCQFSSPLARSSLSGTPRQMTATENRPNPLSFGRSFDASGQYARPSLGVPPQMPQISTEAEAIHILMSMCSNVETSSQCVTPTPQSYMSRNKENRSARGHKRTLSSSEHLLQSQVRSILTNDNNTIEVIEDAVVPLYGSMSKDWQLPSKQWAAPKRALPNLLDNKRVASYCSLQQCSSTPNLATTYREDGMLAAL